MVIATIKQSFALSDLVDIIIKSYVDVMFCLVLHVWIISTTTFFVVIVGISR